MRGYRILSGLVAVMISVSSASAARLYFSELGPGEGATPGNPTINIGLGDTATLYLWADLGVDETISAMGLSILPSNPNVLSPTSTVVENPAVISPYLPTYLRWNDFFIDPDAVTGDVDRFNAIAGYPDIGSGITGLGLVGAYTASDPTYEPGAGLLVGSISYTALYAATVNVNLQVNDWTGLGAEQVYFGVGDDPVDFTAPGSTSTLPDATISVDTGPQYPLGDCNHDGAVNNLDIAYFISLEASVLFTHDVNRDGAHNNLDIAPFISLLTGAPMPSPAPQPNLLGDVSGDGFVNAQDLAAFLVLLTESLEDFFSIYPNGQPEAADLDGDPFTSPRREMYAFFDYLEQIMAGVEPDTYGEAAPLIPEPATVLLLLAGAGALLGRGRR